MSESARSVVTSEAQKALERKVLDYAVSAREGGDMPIDDVMAVADAYGDARELKGHVAACLLQRPNRPDEDRFLWTEACGEADKSGDIYYCDDARELMGNGSAESPSLGLLT